MEIAKIATIKQKGQTLNRKRSDLFPRNMSNCFSCIVNFEGLSVALVVNLASASSVDALMKSQANRTKA